MLCFVVVMQSFIMNSHEVFIHIHQGCFAGTGAIVRLPQCQWSRPAGYGKISQCITTTKHSKAKTVCIFLGIYCSMSRVFIISSNQNCVYLYFMSVQILRSYVLIFIARSIYISPITSGYSAKVNVSRLTWQLIAVLKWATQEGMKSISLTICPS